MLEINGEGRIWEVRVSGFWDAILQDTILPDTESTTGVTVFGPGLKGVRKVRKDFSQEKLILLNRVPHPPPPQNAYIRCPQSTFELSLLKEYLTNK